MATHSSILAWEIPWTEKPGGLQQQTFWVLVLGCFLLLLLFCPLKQLHCCFLLDFESSLFKTKVLCKISNLQTFLSACGLSVFFKDQKFLIFIKFIFPLNTFTNPNHLLKVCLADI